MSMDSTSDKVEPDQKRTVSEEGTSESKQIATPESPGTNDIAILFNKIRARESERQLRLLSTSRARWESHQNVELDMYNFFSMY
jgi:hypothetical protein